MADAVAALTEASFRGWTPVRVNVHEPTVEWAVLPGPPADPFFEQTADAAMRRPFNAAFGRVTPLDALTALGEGHPHAQPSGVIFHQSRCGSTLVTQMLSRVAGVAALSEAQPFDGVLRRAAADGDEDVATARLRGLAHTFGRGAGRLVVKMQAWHVVLLPLIARAWPDSPWLFLFREPRAVLASHERIHGAELDPAVVLPELLGLTAPRDGNLTGYGARAVGAFGEAALRFADTGRSLFVDYAALPDAVASRVAPFFGVPVAPLDALAMREAARRDTKRPVPFTAPASVPSVSPEVLAAADGLRPLYEALRARADYAR